MNPEYAHIGKIETRVIEECSELIQALAKADRFGLGCYDPYTKISNLDSIKSEIEDVLRVVIELKNMLDNDFPNVTEPLN